ncbi:MAG: PfkB family carbohydrate kinase, partial [Chloroflexota bacterium]
MEKLIDIIVSGHLCLDLLPMMDNIRLNDLPSPGHLFEVGPMGFSTGGAVSNTGLALHKLGVNVALMSNVGDDQISRLILAFLENRDPALTRHIRTKMGQASSYTLVLSPERVDRIFLQYAGTNATFTSDNLDYEVIAQSKLLHLGYPPLLPSLTANSGEELARLFQRTKAVNVITSLDMSLPDAAGLVSQVDWKSLLVRTLPFVDIFVPSIEEIMFMLRREDYERWHGKILAHISSAYLDDLADELFQMSNGAIVGFKLGELGLYLCGGRREQFTELQALPIDAGLWAEHRFWHPA